MAVTKGGNNIFGHIVSPDDKHRPMLNLEALEEALTVFANEILSPVYIGWVKGYLDQERVKVETFAKERNIAVKHPREAFQGLIADMKKSENVGWLD